MTVHAAPSKTIVRGARGAIALGLAFAACLSSLVFAGACRTYDDFAPVDAGADASAAGDAGSTRDQPPVVRPAAGTITVDTFAGKGPGGTTAGVGTEASLMNPTGIALEPSGDLVVTQPGPGSLVRISKTQQTAPFAGGFPTASCVVATKDALYVATDGTRDDPGAQGGTIWKPDNPQNLEATGNPGTVVATSPGRIRGLAVLLDGRLAVADADRHVVSILHLADGAVTPLAGNPGAPGRVDGRGALATLREPNGLAVLPDGSLVVADRGNHSIRRITLDGDVTTFAGDGNPGMRDDPERLLARFDTPRDVAVDLFGNVYVTDSGNNRVRRITVQGGVETIAGDGGRGYSDGPGATAQFYGEGQIEVTPDGKTLFVTDGDRNEGGPFNRVRRIVVPGL